MRNVVIAVSVFLAVGGILALGTTSHHGSYELKVSAVAHADVLPEAVDAAFTRGTPASDVRFSPVSSLSWPFFTLNVPVNGTTFLFGLVDTTSAPSHAVIRLRYGPENREVTLELPAETKDGASVDLTF